MINVIVNANAQFASAVTLVELKQVKLLLTYNHPAARDAPALFVLHLSKARASIGPP
eukprot:CAMPEP_0185323650 /NCGR_PEP_ID=MMETSP1363-20130426/62310_1 /TAXON_ID=38817 /ORGANISM="Gephyrocapsa oceanica, Strain RCC1303" /LENGTH=56 /DNA_ID=CAMNT_0027922249 /DNA_START=93 /DNA_END=260 /DNA_ORIENTATION=-